MDVGRSQLGSAGQPRQVETRQGERFVGPVVAALIEAADEAAGQNGQIGVGGRTGMERSGYGPGAATIAAETNRHALAARTGGVGEEKLSARKRLDAPLADRLDKRPVPFDWREGQSPVMAAGGSPKVSADMVAAVDV